MKIATQGDYFSTIAPFVAGGAASVIARTTDAPMERIKLILQNSHRSGQGFTSVLVDVIRNQGVLSLWRGNFTNCLRVGPAYSLRFFFFDRFQSIAQIISPSPSNSRTLTSQLIAGGISGASTTLLLYPLDLARTRLALTRSQTRPSLLSTLRNAVQTSGIRGLYRGLPISVIEIAPYTGIAMGGYEYFRTRFVGEIGEGDNKWQSALKSLGIGWASGLAGMSPLLSHLSLPYFHHFPASLVCYPMDTVKRQLMMDGTAHVQSTTVGEQPKLLYNNSAIQCIKTLYRTGGVRIFYNGCLVNAAKSAPTAAITFALNDKFREWLGYSKKH